MNAPSEPKWTPGPWTVSLPNEALVIAGDGQEVADTSFDYEERYDECAANARLIAAAPYLYAALDIALAEHDHERGRSDNKRHWSNLARAALAAARGEPRP